MGQNIEVFFGQNQPRTNLRESWGPEESLKWSKMVGNGPEWSPRKPPKGAWTVLIALVRVICVHACDGLGSSCEGYVCT